MDDDKRRAYVALVPDDVRDETSDESFDRMAFAERAVALVKPPRTRVAICPGARTLRVASGKQWGGPAGSRWATITIPPTASRRAIALAVAELSGSSEDAVPYAFDVLLREGVREEWRDEGVTGGRDAEGFRPSKSH